METLKVGTRVVAFSENWRGKVRRRDVDNGMMLIQWSYCASLPTDICTWIFPEDVLQEVK